MSIEVVHVQPYEGLLDEGIDPSSEEAIRYLAGKGEQIYKRAQRLDKAARIRGPQPRSEFVPSPKRVRALPWSGGRRWDR